MHTQANFFTNFFKDATKEDRHQGNNNSDKITHASHGPDLSSSTKNSAPNRGALNGTEHVLPDNVGFTQGNQSASQKPPAKTSATHMHQLPNTHAPQYIHGQYTPPTSPLAAPNLLYAVNMPRKAPLPAVPSNKPLVEISPFFYTGYHRLFIGVSTTVAQRVDLIDGIGYYAVEELLPWIYRSFVDNPLKRKASPQNIRTWVGDIRLAIENAKRCLMLVQKQTQDPRPHFHQWYTFYSLVSLFGFQVQYCPHGTSQTCENMEDVFGTFYGLSTSYKDHESLLVRMFIRTHSGKDFVKDIEWTGSQYDTGLLRHHPFS